MDKVIVTVINGIGIVESKNDRATFSLNIKTKAETLEQSGQQLNKLVADANEMLSTLPMKLDGDKVTDIYNYKLEHREGTERYSAGFQSVATIKWTIVVDESLDKVFQSCLKLDPNMSRPYFSFKDRKPLEEQALQKAVADAFSKLNSECELLGVDPKNLQILNWNIGYNGTIQTVQNGQYSNNYSGSTFAALTGVTGPQGSVGMNGSAAGSGHLTQKLGSIYQELLDYQPLEPGSVLITVPVIINYVWK